ncbi:MAG: hypothetical protein H0X40_09175 [Chthoniobacterales bacterium]|nr:hypothetical protein [Chthoniobacterales bacterium]
MSHQSTRPRRPDFHGGRNRALATGGLIALTRGHRMKCLLRRMLDPDEFLSDYAITSNIPTFSTSAESGRW